jgi:integrase
MQATLLLRTKVHSLSGNLAGRKRSVPYFCWFELLSASSGHIRFHQTPNCSAACYITRLHRLGVKIGNWLTVEEGRRLLSGAGNATLRERRNYAMLAVLAGCGLRRAEAAALKIEDLQLREGHWVLAHLNGKGGHIRTVPVPDWVKTAIDQWAIPASIISETLFRSINKAGRVWGTGFTPKVIWSIVKQAASNSGLSRVAPHDLRRTCAKLCHEAGGELEQIQFCLATFRCKPQSFTWDANNVFAMQ